VDNRWHTALEAGLVPQRTDHAILVLERYAKGARVAGQTRIRGLGRGAYTSLSIRCFV
jgi:hypothetical protein